MIRHETEHPTKLPSDRVDWLIWPISLWPEHDRQRWVRSRLGKGPEGPDSPAIGWRGRTLKNNEIGYGGYLAWLARKGLFVEEQGTAERLTPDRIGAYVAELKARLSSTSVAMYIGSLASAASVLSPETDWSWLRHRATRLKLKAKPSREKRQVVQHTLDLYRYGKRLMDTAGEASRSRRASGVAAAKRYQAGLIIALLAARPLRIRNFQALTVGGSLRWDGKCYWLTFSTNETKTASAIDEPLPADLVPYLEKFLKTWRPLLLRQAAKHGPVPVHRRLWVDVFGKPMTESTLREIIKCRTKKEFGTALWPHLFRDCLLTSVAIDQPDLMRTSSVLLGHTSYKTGEKHYNQAHMLHAGRRYVAAISDLRESFLNIPSKSSNESTRQTGHGPAGLKVPSPDR